ncbi:MAG: sigma-70 family RNA polymerase sigma factor [Muribaculaceae bacterium]|nr:sigma-70 family RNA polymerase sigma factor [Muribaculaceae bacterium]
MKKFDEIALISRCVLADDRNAFGVLVEAYQPTVRRFFMNLTLGNAALTDDLAQETFIKAYLNIRSFRGLSSFSTWLYRIAYNEFYSHSRRNAEMALTDDDLRSHDRLTDTIAASDAAMDVKVAFRALTDTERAIVTMFYIDDLPLKRIATVMQMPQGTVKSHLHRAKEKMARAVQ